ncbi:MAG: hypothetical protein ACYC2H_01090 [Thermoplasmatota archaeon]
MPDESPLRVAVAGLQAAVREALELYALHHVMTEAVMAEAAGDFLRFYTEAIQRGTPGIRWNFNGCILCPDQSHGPKLCARILLASPTVLAATGGRPFGTMLCAEHHAALAMRLNPQQALDDAALVRLRRDDPVSGSNLPS